MKKQLLVAKNEKDVENAYRAEFLRLMKNAKITSPYGVDGLIEFDTVRSLLEFKYQEDLKNKLSQCGILIQALYYLKKFENSGQKLPNVIFVGDINECFAIHTNSIIKYLSHHIDWGIAPSGAYKNNPDTIKAMVEDVDILPFVFDINDDFDLKSVVEKIKDFNDNVVRLVRVTEHNIEAIFDYFIENVLEKTKLTTNEQANLFIAILINPQDNYLHPNKKNVLVTKNMGEVKVNGPQFKSFFKHFEYTYGIKEKEKLTSIVDRLVEDTTRRRKGEFFTPTIWVDEAHKMIEENLGKDWKEKYVVWDPAWGTGNLTRDYKFKELYCSTIEASDIHTANQMGYNPEAVKFQYDFLNDGIFLNEETGQYVIDVDMDDKMPQGLKDAIQNSKPIVVLMNPPYKRVSNQSFGIGKDIEGDGVIKNMIYKIMENENVGNSSDNMYTQFLFKLIKLQNINKKINIGVFCPPIYLSGQAFKKFRNKLFLEYSFVDGFLFEASHFSDVATGWGITFNILKSQNEIYKNEFKFRIKDFNQETFNIVNVSEKMIYNLDIKGPASVWVREETSKLKTFDTINLSSPLKVSDVVKTRSGKCVENNFGYYFCGGNNIGTNITHNSLFTAAYSGGIGLSIIKDNFLKCTSLFTARETILPNWINCKDEYLAPNEEHPKFEQFKYDSLVYSLFNNSSQQSSLRQIRYKEKLWDIKNEFFWLSKERLKELAEENDFDLLYQDARTSNERYVYELLFGEQRIYDKLSPDAKQVLDTATQLLEKSFSMRKLMSEGKPEYHLQAWDAGYAQLKLVWKQYFKSNFDTFRKLYKSFEDRMRPLVYELGFLLGDDITDQVEVEKQIELIEN